MKAISFGPHKRLLGILHESKDTRKDLIAVLWNTGICGRMGPSRMNVEISDLLQKDGIPSFRFDLGNLGDSLSGSSESDIVARNQADLKAALDELEDAHGYRNFLLIGICSSAVDAYHGAVIDPRVKGLVMVDTFAFPTPKFHRRYVYGRILSPLSWRRLALRKFREWTNRTDANASQVGETETDYLEGVWPEEAEAEKGFRCLVDRGVPMLVLYTGGFQHVYSYAQQFLDMFPTIDWKGLLELRHHPRSDHLYTILEDRADFFDILKHWSMRNFSSSQQRPALAPAKTKNTTLLDILQRIDQQDGSTLAVTGLGSRLSYDELKRESVALAHALKTHAPEEKSLIGLCLDRSSALIVSLLGILRAGHAYLPLDTHYPKDRLRAMIEISRCNVVLCHARDAELYRSLGARVLVWEELNLKAFPQNDFASPKILSHDPAYVIFTSGSTGQPKGVVMGHGALSQLLNWHAERYPLARPRTLQFTPISFDVSFQEIFTTLQAGGTLALIAEEDRLDPRVLLDTLEKDKIQRLFLPFVALQFLAEATRALKRTPESLVEVFTAGEALKTTPALRALFQALPGATLHNHYGPSETHVITAYELPKDPMSWDALPSIGQPIAGSFVLLLDPKTFEPVPTRAEGELFLGGLSLAEGYIHRQDLTNERFIAHPRDPNSRLYRTGDLGYQDEQGNIFFLGRSDNQIKIRGHRIELGEIETTLGEFPGLGQVLVQPLSEKGETYLALYSSRPFDEAALRRFAAEKLPEAMRPSYFLTLDAFPLTPSGKVDRKKLPSPFASATKDPTLAPAKGRQTQDLLAVLRGYWRDLLPSSSWDEDTNFFDAGGTSILAARFVARLKEERDIDLHVRDVFAYPTLRRLSDRLEGQITKKGMSENSFPEVAAASVPRSGNDEDQHAIAVIGLAATAPGAEDLSSFWQLLVDGREGLSQLSRTEDRGPSFVPVQGLISDRESFDHEFFHISKREAEWIDPQQRRLLELSSSALDDAGYSDKASEIKTGVFVGTGYNTYLIKQFMENPKALRTAGDFQVMLANDKDYAATRIAYKLDLKGPALSLHTACSTSLVAIVNAVKSLRGGECDLALAGAVSIQFPADEGHHFTEGGILSRDGHCRPFDAKASGTVFSDGGGVVVLKRLSDAERDGDRIYSVIRGVAWNNDGRDKASFSAPSLFGQKEVIEMALRDAKVRPEEIDFVEAHGTATPIGDPLEWEALREAYEGSRPLPKDSIRIGSLKSNIGHTTAAAGVLGLIKTSLALYTETLPGTLHFERLNPEIKPGPFYVTQKTLPWPRASKKRRAGLSSFGIGGTNAHIVVEESSVARRVSTSSQEIIRLPLSHATEEGLDKMQRRIESILSQNDASALQLALAKGRKHYNRRRVLSVKKGTILKEESISGSAHRGALVWSFPGQGSQEFLMGQDLYRSDEGFRKHFDELMSLVKQRVQFDFASCYWKGETRSVRDTRDTQLGLFMIGYALGRTLFDHGITPKALIGHSIGEWAAAALSGIFRLEDAIDAISLRGEWMRRLPQGAMLSARMNPELAKRLCPKELDIAASNAEDQQVFSGSKEAIANFQDVLKAKDIGSRLLEVNHAFHSRELELAIAPLNSFLQTIELSPPKLPILSTVSGTWLDDHRAMDPTYWARHARVTVDFLGAAETLKKDLGPVLALELGPKGVSSKLLQKTLGPTSQAVALLSEEKKARNDLTSTLWLYGALGAEAFLANRESENEAERAIGLSYEFMRQHSSVAIAQNTQNRSEEPEPTPKGRPMSQKIRVEIRSLLESSLGEVLSESDDKKDFQELGFDSLALTSLALALGRRFGMEFSLRQLMAKTPTIEALAEHIAREAPTPTQMDEALPPRQERLSERAETRQQASQLFQTRAEESGLLASEVAQLTRVFEQQLEIMRMQLALLNQSAQHPAQLRESEKSSVNSPVDELTPLPPAQSLGLPAEKEEKAREDARLFTHYYTDHGKFKTPSHPHAKLGIDSDGQAAWFVPDPARIGHYLRFLEKVDTAED